MFVRAVLLHVMRGGLLIAVAASGGSLAAEPSQLEVSARQPWTPTAVRLKAGQRVTIEAGGTARVVRLTVGEALFGYDFDRHVGPEGTYVWPSNYATRRPHRQTHTFPLPAGQDGPHPAFCLIGKIGQDGTPFYVGRHYHGVAKQRGELWLGINDDRVSDNHGGFRVSIEVDGPPPPTSPPPPVVQPSGQGNPLEDARVLLLYVDGLRPDVVHEMASGGFLPNIQTAFLDRGLECANAFTTFPSNTLTANGALFTGLFPDRTGIKSQNQFERTTLKARGSFSEWLPDWLVMRTSPAPRVSDLLDKFAPENTHHVLRQRGIHTLGSVLGSAYRYTILPIVPLNPPSQWLHRALNTVRNPFAAAVDIPHELDRINARYVIEELLGDPEARVISAWFPMVDKVSHHSARGQFGAARREIVVVDRLIGKILKRLRQIHWDTSTYLILMSDHGHLGGEETVNRRCNLARDFFHRQLGCNVNVIGQCWLHPGQPPSRFVFMDHQAWGQASVFLPKGSYHDGPWQRNSLADLRHYDVGPNLGAVDLVKRLAAFTGPEWEPGLPAPVDLILVKLDATRVLVYRSEDNQAIIHIHHQDDEADRYRYEPVRQLEQTAEGQVNFKPPHPRTDPLGWLRDATVRRAIGTGESVVEFFARPHTAEEWLRVTVATEYPDAVVGIATFFNWRSPVEELADARDPDVVVTASRGWSFRTADEEGTDHGSPLREAMRMSLFLAGPRLRHGVLQEPRRIVDVMPTVLEMVGVPVDLSQLDGRPIRGIYE